MNAPYLYIGALDLSPYIVSVHSPQIALRGLSAELEQEIYAILNFGKRYNKWWTRTNSRREAWRKEKQAKLF